MAVGVATALAAVVFGAESGLRLGRTTTVEMALLLTSGLAVAAAALTAPRSRLVYGAGTAGLLAALAGLAALSIGWAVQPADAWLETSRALAYAAVFAGAIALVRMAPGRWRGVLSGLLLGAVAVSVAALATKVAPGAFAEDALYARLREPFGYWNAVGLMAALGVPVALWLGSRREGSPLASALAYPAVGLLLVTALLAFSRGSLFAAAVGAALWFALVPDRRLRATAVLLAGLAGAALVGAWAFAQDALTQDAVVLGERSSAGLELGILLAVVLLGLFAVGVAVGFRATAAPLRPEARRRIGLTLVVLLALTPGVAAVGLAFSDEGLGGSISSGWRTLTDPAASVPENDPSRLTSTGSVRARYWDEAFQIFEANTVTGAGAGGYATARLRHRENGLVVRHAHGYVPETLANLGLLGLGLSLLVVGALALAVRRTLRGAGGPERVGLVTLTAVVVAFAAHSLIDWTWLVPGTAVAALFAAGWVAGRGPEPLGALGDWRPRLSPLRLGMAAVAIAGALAAAWAVWQPLRAEQTGSQALSALERGDLDRARELALKAQKQNPLSIDPLLDLAAVKHRSGRKDRAVVALRQAVDLQPANPVAWHRLGEYELYVRDRPRKALEALRAAVYLDPQSFATKTDLVEAVRRLGKDKAAKVLPPEAFRR